MTRPECHRCGNSVPGYLAFYNTKEGLGRRTAGAAGRKKILFWHTGHLYFLDRCLFRILPSACPSNIKRNSHLSESDRCEIPLYICTRLQRTHTRTLSLSLSFFWLENPAYPLRKIFILKTFVMQRHCSHEVHLIVQLAVTLQSWSTLDCAISPWPL